MKRLSALLLLLLQVHAAGAPESPERKVPDTVPRRIDLRDQFDKPQLVEFPVTNLFLLTIADKKGSEQIAGWVQPAKLKYGTRIQIRGIADVSSVPRLLRSMVRKQFQKIQSYPVMMDWTGEVVNAITYKPDMANILILDGEGHVAARMTGAASENSLHQLFQTIDRALENIPGSTKLP